MKSLARKFSIRLEDLKAIFHTFTKYDILVIDDTRPTTRLRKNVFETIAHNIFQRIEHD